MFSIVKVSVCFFTAQRRREVLGSRLKWIRAPPHPSHDPILFTHWTFVNILVIPRIVLENGQNSHFCLGSSDSGPPDLFWSSRNSSRSVKLHLTWGYFGPGHSTNYTQTTPPQHVCTLKKKKKSCHLQSHGGKRGAAGAGVAVSLTSNTDGSFEGKAISARFYP